MLNFKLKVLSRNFEAENKFLERTRGALTKAELHDKIKTSLAEYGMDKPKIDF